MEIVAPAGDYNRFLASVKAGGNAIYNKGYFLVMKKKLCYNGK